MPQNPPSAIIYASQAIAALDKLRIEVDVMDDAFKAINNLMDLELNSMSFTKAVMDVLVERARQIHQEGYTLEHDDEHEQNELIFAGAAYALHVAEAAKFGWVDKYLRPHFWPAGWAWKPADPRTRLVKAAALLLAAIERMDRNDARST